MRMITLAFRVSGCSIALLSEEFMSIGHLLIESVSDIYSSNPQSYVAQ